MTKFEQGDVVVLNSGGPGMTVVERSEEDLDDGWVRVEWFDSQGIDHSDEYPVYALREPDSGDKSPWREWQR